MKFDVRPGWRFTASINVMTATQARDRLVQAASFALVAGFCSLPVSDKLLPHAFADESSSTIVRTVHVGASPVDLADCAGRLLVVNSVAKSLQVVDVEHGYVKQTLSTGQHPVGILAHPNAGHAYVSLVPDIDNPELSGQIAKIDCRSLNVLETATVGNYPSGQMALDDDGNLYVPNQFDPSISVLDAQTLLEKDKVTVPNVTDLLVRDSKLLVSQWSDSKTLSVYRLPDFALQATHPLSAFPGGLSGETGRIYIPDPYAGIVRILDLSDDFESVQESLTLAVGADPYHVAVADDRLFISNAGDDSLSVFDEDTLELVETLTVGDRPTKSLLFGGFLVVANAGSNSLSIVDVGATRLEGPHVVHESQYTFDSSFNPNYGVRLAVSRDAVVQLAVWQSCPGAPKKPICRLHSRRSVDGGVTWSESVTAWESSSIQALQISSFAMTMSEDGSRAAIGVTGYTWSRESDGSQLVTSGFHEIVRSNDAAQSWQPRQVLSLVGLQGDCNDNSLASSYCRSWKMDFDGSRDLETLVVAWSVLELDEKRYVEEGFQAWIGSVKYVVSSDFGQSWSDVGDLELLNGSDVTSTQGVMYGGNEYPRVRVSSSGETITISSLRRGVTGVAFSSSFDGGDSWSAPSIVAPVFVYNYFNWDVSADGSTLVSAAHETSYGGPSRLLVSRSEDAGLNWSQSTVIDSVDLSNVTEAAVSMSPSGQYILVAYSAYDAATSVSELRTLLSTDFGESFGSALSVKRHDVPLIDLNAVFDSRSESFFLGFTTLNEGASVYTLSDQDSSWIPLPRFGTLLGDGAAAMAVGQSAGRLAILVMDSLMGIRAYQHSASVTPLAPTNVAFELISPLQLRATWSHSRRLTDPHNSYFLEFEYETLQGSRQTRSITVPTSETSAVFTIAQDSLDTFTVRVAAGSDAPASAFSPEAIYVAGESQVRDLFALPTSLELTVGDVVTITPTVISPYELLSRKWMLSQSGDSISFDAEGKVSALSPGNVTLVLEATAIGLDGVWRASTEVHVSSPATSGTTEIEPAPDGLLAGASATPHVSSPVSVVPLAGLVAQFGEVTSLPDGISVPVLNFDPAFTWHVTSSSGSVELSSDGILVVSGLAANVSVHVTVRTQRAGFLAGEAIIMGRSDLAAAWMPMLALLPTTEGFEVRIMDLKPSFTLRGRIESTTSSTVPQVMYSDGVFRVSNLSRGSSALLVVTSELSGHHEGLVQIVGSLGAPLGALGGGRLPEPLFANKSPTLAIRLSARDLSVTAREMKTLASVGRRVSEGRLESFKVVVVSRGIDLQTAKTVVKKVTLHFSKLGLKVKKDRVDLPGAYRFVLNVRR